MSTPTQDEIRQCADRLRASLRCDAMNGDAHERAVCAHQMRYAADLLSWLAQQDAVGVVDRLSTPTGWGFQNGPRLYSDDLPVGTLLYAAPVPAPKE